LPAADIRVQRGQSVRLVLVAIHNQLFMVPLKRVII
jgi:hypothetical protein